MFIRCRYLASDEGLKSGRFYRAKVATLIYNGYSGYLANLKISKSVESQLQSVHNELTKCYTENTKIDQACKL